MTKLIHKKCNQKKYVFQVAISIIVIILLCVIYGNINTIKVLNDRISQLEADVQNLVSQLKDKTNTIQQQTITIQNQTQTIAGMEQTIRQKEQQIESQRIQIESLTTQVQSLNSQLGETKVNLQETTRLLDIAKNYEVRVQAGIDLSKAYVLLNDYDMTVGIVRNVTNVGVPGNDREIWKRAKDIYYWLGNNYDYCSDKGFCVGDTCTQIQFFSPDELLYYGSQDVLCGDCDDQAQLFTGMMYASGVPHDKVRVECGTVPGGGHCWGAVNVNSSWYRIDPVCSNPAKYVNFFGYKLLISGKEFPTNFQKVDCFSTYTLTSWYNAEGFQNI